MVGCILAGGKGTRLKPLTNFQNKHTISVFNRPMIWYPIDTLKRMGITDILVVTGPDYAGDFLRYLGSGKSMGCNFTYKIQDEAGGIAHALSLAEDFTKNEKIAVILGDNFFENNFKYARECFEKEVKKTKSGGMIFLKKVKNPERFGVAVFDSKGENIKELVEKPKEPISNMAQTGLYFYTSDVFDIIKTLKPSARGELEITSVNQAYLDKDRLMFEVIDGHWSDVGTFESLWRTSNHIAYKKLKIKNYAKKNTKKN